MSSATQVAPPLAATGVEGPLDVVLCAVGTIGDVNPQLAIGAELRRRGHRVTMLANGRYADACRDATDEFVSVYDSQALDRLSAEAQGFSYNEGYRYHTDTHTLGPMRSVFRVLLERERSSRTVMVASNIAIGARIAQEVAGFPLLTAVSDPHFFRGQGVLKMPRPMLVGSWVPRAIMDLQWRVVDRFFVDPLCRDEINAFRSEFKLPPIRRVMDRWWFSPDGVLAMFPEWWGARHSAWPSHTTTIGFPVYDRSEHEPSSPELQAFLTAGPPPIAYSPGNSHLHEPQHMAAVVAACRSVGRRVILITPRTDHGFDASQSDVLVLRYAPFRQLLRHVQVLVHQAGIGTTAAALRAGVPQLLIPTVFNQPDTAERAERLGCGRVVAPEKFTADRLSRALRSLLDDPQTAIHCRESAKRFAPENEPAVLAADCVERLAAAKQVQATR